MNLRFPWYVRLTGIIIFLTFPLSFTFANPYYIWGGKEKEAERRYKYYRNIHFKPEGEVIVKTAEGNSLYAMIDAGNLPEPTFARIVSDEEVQENGLYVIGGRLIKRGSETSR